MSTNLTKRSGDRGVVVGCALEPTRLADVDRLRMKEGDRIERDRNDRGRADEKVGEYGKRSTMGLISIEGSNSCEESLDETGIDDIRNNRADRKGRYL